MANIDIKDLAILNLDESDLESFMVELGDSSDRNLILGGSQVEFEVLPDGSEIEVITRWPC